MPLPIDSTGAMYPESFKFLFALLKRVHVANGHYWSSHLLNYWRSRFSLAFHRATSAGTHFRLRQYVRETHLPLGLGQANAEQLYARDLLQ